MPVTFELTHFDPTQIMQSGQCFRMKKVDNNAVETIALGRRLVITPLGENRFAFDCDAPTFEAVWLDYFDLREDYRAIHAAAPTDDVFLQRALRYSPGLRILRQDPWETLCGFILSQRKNIKAICTCMEALCNLYGEPLPGTERRAFPTPERLAALHETDMHVCGLGYRAPYLLDAAQRVATGKLNLTALSQMPDEQLFTELLQVSGVGVKVANCVMLFAYHRLSRAPVDVWIERVIREAYGGASPYAGYGPYAGMYQQFQFMLQRDEGAAALASAGRAARKPRKLAAGCACEP